MDSRDFFFRVIKTLPPLDSPSLILSFDFDGTLHQPHDGWPIQKEFFDHVRRMREEHDALWLINTGRSLFHMVQGISECRFPFLPDLIIVRERDIYQPGRFGRWVDLGKWNKNGEKDHKKLFQKAGKQLKELKAFVTGETAAEWIESKEEPAGVIATSLEEMAKIAERADRCCEMIEDLSYERNSIYLRFSHSAYNKGSALQEVQRLAGLGMGETFAIGDGFNDLTMLRPEVAAHLACPHNAIPEVKTAVRQAGGFLSDQYASGAAVDALNSYFFSLTDSSS